MWFFGVTFALATLTAVSEAGIACSVAETWNGGFKVGFALTTETTVNSWSFIASLDGAIDAMESEWIANNARASSSSFTLSNLNTNGNINAGSMISSTIVFQCASKCATGSTYTASLKYGSSTCTAGTGSSGGSSGGTVSKPKDYGDALEKSITFYYAQRSGDLTGTTKPLPWVVSSATSDNPGGGWYDAGDYVKFNHPMAWSAVTLLWSMVRFQSGYVSAGQYNQAKDSIKWALDYFLRCWDNSKKELVVQVGDGDADHAIWDRPQNMATYRPVFKVTTSKPGSDVAGNTAAALAAGSIVFKSSDSAYASKLLTAATQIYDFAKTYQGKYSDSVPQAGAFYSSSGFKDELCVASAWLTRATGQQTYLNDAKSLYYDSATPWAFSWDDSRLACQALLFEDTSESQYKTALENFFKGWLGGSSPSYTPCGLGWRDQWGPLRYAGNVAFVALVANSKGLTSVNSKSLPQFAAQQVNYVLGDNAKRSGSNCYSYLIGYGTNYPQQPHHRAASCPTSTSVACYKDNSKSSPNVLVGALVGGPDSTDQYKDQRTDYIQSEVACDYNAGFQGALAGLAELQASGNLPTTYSNCACP